MSNSSSGSHRSSSSSSSSSSSFCISSSNVSKHSVFVVSPLKSSCDVEVLAVYLMNTGANVWMRLKNWNRQLLCPY